MAFVDTLMDFFFLRCFTGHFLCKVEELENDDEKNFYRNLLKRDLQGMMGSCFKKWGFVVFALLFSSLYFFYFLVWYHWWLGKSCIRKYCPRDIFASCDEIVLESPPVDEVPQVITLPSDFTAANAKSVE